MSNITNIHMATDLLEGKKVHILSESGSVDMTGVCKFIKSISFSDREDPTIVMDLSVNASISFSVESPLSLIRVADIN
jgi:hypothetical protein